jgi:hypothetical protein
MKIEHLLARHFYSAKQLTLQGIGTFTLSPDFVMPAETDKDNALPPGAITFTQNSRATEDTALIEFIVQQTRKMRPLASSDLDSFISLGSQFLNIGKPFKIDGMGVLEKNQLGEYLFTQQGLFANPRGEDAPVQIKEKQEERISFATEEKARPANTKKMLLLLAAFIVLGGLGWAGWYFFTHKKADTATENNVVAPVTIPPVTDTAKKDTAALSMKPDSSTVIAVNNAANSFRVVIKTYPTLLLAQKAFTRLTNYGHKVQLYTNDSVVYKIAMPFTLPLADTAYVKDSLRKFFNAKTAVELQ